MFSVTTKMHKKINRIIVSSKLTFKTLPSQNSIMTDSSNDYISVLLFRKSNVAGDMQAASRNSCRRTTRKVCSCWRKRNGRRNWRRRLAPAGTSSRGNSARAGWTSTSGRKIGGWWKCASCSSVGSRRSLGRSGRTGSSGPSPGRASSSLRLRRRTCSADTRC